MRSMLFTLSTPLAFLGDRLSPAHDANKYEKGETNAIPGLIPGSDFVFLARVATFHPRATLRT
jgi:hypothetical protein